MEGKDCPHDFPATMVSQNLPANYDPLVAEFSESRPFFFRGTTELHGTIVVRHPADPSEFLFSPCLCNHP